MMQRTPDDYPPFVRNLGPQAMDIYDQFVGDADLASVEGPDDGAALLRFEVRMKLASAQLCSYPIPMIVGCSCIGCAGAGEGWGADSPFIPKTPLGYTWEERRLRRFAKLRATRRRHR